MFEQPTGTRLASWRSWRSTIAKVLVVLLFPLVIQINYGGFIWFSLLLQVGGSIFTLFETAIMFLISIVIMVPGIYLERKIKTKPIEESIRKKILGVLLLTWGVPTVLSFNVNPLSSLVYVYIPLVFLPIVSISVFIILPVLNREFIVRHTTTELHHRTYSQLSNGFKMQIGRKRHLPLIIWTGLLFAPIVIVSQWTQIFESIISSMVVSSMRPVFDYLSSILLIYNIQATTTLPFVFLLFSIRFLFLRDIIRFNGGNVTRSRLVSMGILAEIAPVAILTLTQFISYIIVGYPFSFFNPLLPTPLFPILGYIYVRKTRNLVVTNLLWDEEEHKMWFDSEKSSVLPSSIKVPITYIIRSKLRRQRSQ